MAISAGLRQPGQQDGRERVGRAVRPVPAGVTRRQIAEQDDDSDQIGGIPGERFKRPEETGQGIAARQPIPFLGKHSVQGSIRASQGRLDRVEKLARGGLGQQGKDVVEAGPTQPVGLLKDLADGEESGRLGLAGRARLQRTRKTAKEGKALREAVAKRCRMNPGLAVDERREPFVRG